MYGQELRKIVYAACGLKTAKEIQRVGMEMKEETIQIKSSSFALAESVKLSAEQRQELVLKLILGAEPLKRPELSQKILNIKDQHMQLMVACLVYFTKAYNPTSEVFCAISSAIFFPLKD